MPIVRGGECAIQRGVLRLSMGWEFRPQPGSRGRGPERAFDSLPGACRCDSQASEPHGAGSAPNLEILWLAARPVLPPPPRRLRVGVGAGASRHNPQEILTISSGHSGALGRNLGSPRRFQRPRARVHRPDRLRPPREEEFQASWPSTIAYRFTTSTPK